MKTFIPEISRGFDETKTTFSYFPGLFENPAPAVKTSFQQNINYKQNKKNIL